MKPAVRLPEKSHTLDLQEDRRLVAFDVLAVSVRKLGRISSSSVDKQRRLDFTAEGEVRALLPAGDVVGGVLPALPVDFAPRLDPQHTLTNAKLSSACWPRSGRCELLED